MDWQGIFEEEINQAITEKKQEEITKYQMEDQEISSKSSVTSIIEQTKSNKLRRGLSFTLSDFKFIQVKRQGSQGEVYMASSIHFSQKVAIKTLKLSNPGFNFEKLIERIQNQISINFQTSQKQNKYFNYFPSFHGYFTQNQTVYLIFQLCSSNSLQFLKKLKTYEQRYTFCFILLHDMIKALTFLEEKQILHRDIKPENILMQDGYFKLADLGLARKTLRQKRLTIDVGNIFSKSPQFYSGNYNQKSDVWALGITLHYLLENKLPFDNLTLEKLTKNSSLDEYIKKIQQTQFTVNISSSQLGNQIFSFRQIFQKMIVPCQNKRLYASQIRKQLLQRVQLQKIDYEKIIYSLILSKKYENTSNLISFFRFLLLQYLQHRGNTDGLYYVVVLAISKQILRINQKICKIQKVMQMVDSTTWKKRNFQLLLLKKIKNVCFKLIEFLSSFISQKINSKIMISQMTSFGQIQVEISTDQKGQNKEKLQLCKFLKQLLEAYNQNEKEIVTMQRTQRKNEHKKQEQQKTVKFKQVTTQIQQIQQIQQISMKQRYKLKNQDSQSEEIKTFRPKSRKYIESINNKNASKLPKSLKYINQQNEQNKGPNNVSFLENFLKLYEKDKLKQRFPLLGQGAELLKKIIQISDDKIEQSKFMKNQFKLWNLSLQLFKI